MSQQHVIDHIVQVGNKTCVFIDSAVRCTTDKDPLPFIHNLTSVFVSKWETGFGCIMKYGVEVCNFAESPLELLISVLK